MEVEQKTTLFDKLGGPNAVKAVVEEFYHRLVNDEATSPFFVNINMGVLKRHQVEFMKIAFTAIPSDLDVAALMTEKHKSLFAQGLDESHFDVVAKHFVGACQHLSVPQDLIDEALAVIGPLRPVFENGARTFGPNDHSPPQTLFEKLGGPGAVKAVVEEFYSRLLGDSYTSRFFVNVKMSKLKKHQIEFFKIAFTGIPADLDVPSLLTEKHKLLFVDGLNETHFDVVATHFVGACQHLNVPQDLIDEAVGVIAPLRTIFTEGAKKYGLIQYEI